MTQALNSRLPCTALSIQHPWAWLIVHGWKDLENRDWSTNFRGGFLIHASKTLDVDAAEALARGINPCFGGPMPEGFKAPEFYECGGIVGDATIVDCIQAGDYCVPGRDPRTNSKWFVGPKAFVIRDARPLPFAPMRGKLSFFAAGYSRADASNFAAMPATERAKYLNDGLHAKPIGERGAKARRAAPADVAEPAPIQADLFS